MEHELHREYKNTITAFCKLNNWTTYHEVQLPNNKIADIVAVNTSTRILIFEVKTTATASLIEAAYNKYHEYCDGLYIALDYEDAQNIAAQKTLIPWRTNQDDVGLLGIRQNTVRVIRTAMPHEITKDAKLSLANILSSRHPAW